MVENVSVTCPEEIKAPVLTPRSDRRNFSSIEIDRDHLGRVTDGLVLVSGLWVVSRHGVVPHVIGIDLGNPLFHPRMDVQLSLIHISEPTRRRGISYAVFCLKKKKRKEKEEVRRGGGGGGGVFFFF